MVARAKRGDCLGDEHDSEHRVAPYPAVETPGAMRSGRVVDVALRRRARPPSLAAALVKQVAGVDEQE